MLKPVNNIATALVKTMTVVFYGLLLALLIVPLLLAIMAAVAGNLGSAIVLLIIQIALWSAVQ